MQFEFESYDEKIKRLDQWRNWFAWHPVFLDDTDKPTIVWLEMVQRKKVWPSRPWRYRKPTIDYDFEVHP